MSESDCLGKSIALHIRHVQEVDATVERDGTIETGQDEPILLIDFRRIASARHYPRFSFIRLASQT